MATIPFKVSARTVNLLGNENVANAAGAINEIVKNAYDASARRCYIILYSFADIFDTPVSAKYISELQRKIHSDDSLTEYDTNDLINECFEKDKTGNYSLSSELHPEFVNELKDFIQKKQRIYIIDDGIGFSEKSIVESWMTIGYSNKQHDILSAKYDRVQSGEKGIGRLSLGRIGDRCRLVSISNDLLRSGSSLFWEIDWSLFEDASLDIKEIEATLEYKEIGFFAKKIPPILNERQHFDTGTILKITNLKDLWTTKLRMQVLEQLETFLPPEELTGTTKKKANFSLITNFHNRSQLQSVAPPIFDDWDYKIEAVSDGTHLFVTGYRNEIDLARIGSDLKKLLIQVKNVDLDSSTFEQRILLSGAEKSIGPFSCSLYFLKNSVSKNEQQIYFYKPVSRDRKSFLKRFEGIKIYRDGIKIRPYGESGPSLDWLGLGARATQSPAGVASDSGGYRVRPNNMIGIIELTREGNPLFLDKSSREGVQENATFQSLKDIIRKRLLPSIEQDRSKIAQLLRKHYYENHVDEDYVKNLVDSFGKNKQATYPAAEVKALVEFITKAKVDLEDTLSEVQTLRALASNGLILSSFAHDFLAIKRQLTNFHEIAARKVNELFEKLGQSPYEGKENPAYYISRAGDAVEKASMWFTFAREILNRDKRRRKKLFFKDYFVKLQETASLLVPDAKLNFSLSDEKLSLRAFEADLDAIFYNLLLNSGYFLQKQREKIVSIEVGSSEDFIFIVYQDNGQGLDDGLTSNPDIIFEPFETTKPQGLGMGMYIVKNAVLDYKGECSVIPSDSGFKIQIALRGSK